MSVNTQHNITVYTQPGFLLYVPDPNWYISKSRERQKFRNNTRNYIFMQLNLNLFKY